MIYIMGSRKKSFEYFPVIVFFSFLNLVFYNIFILHVLIFLYHSCSNFFFIT